MPISSILLWNTGICGDVVSSSDCQATCTEQKWDWNYVDCLEDSVVNGM